MQNHFIALQGSYGHLELALFKYPQVQVVESIYCVDTKASSHLVSRLSELLIKYNLLLSDLKFIAVDFGPGAFTSLRVIVASVNGLAFATSIPLVGVSGLQALSEQSLSSLNNKKTNLNVSHVVCLLNAYNNDVYELVRKVAWDDSEKQYKFTEEGTEGCVKIDLTLNALLGLDGVQNIFFNGNAVALHKTIISETLQNRALVAEPIDNSCSANQIGIMAADYWQNKKNVTTKLIPNYLKTQKFAIKN